jgi:hypothetical protein
MLFLKLPQQPKSRLPFFPHPREYWAVRGYEPYTWTLEDVRYAWKIGWHHITFQTEDEYPYLKGTMHGYPPDYPASCYLPKKPDDFCVLTQADLKFVSDILNKYQYRNQEYQDNCQWPKYCRGLMFPKQVYPDKDTGDIE